MPRKLFIIPGHGAGDSGAVGGGKNEADLVRDLATSIKKWGGSYVKLAAFSRNYYADNGISKLILSKKSWRILELHMDSGPATAKGGHVIIDSSVKENDWIKALADFIEGMFPGHSEAIDARSDLANPKRAAAKGYPYVLVENGFISNATDRKRFISHTDELAKGILGACGYPLGGKYKIIHKTAVRKSASVLGKRLAVLNVGDIVTLHAYRNSTWAKYETSSGTVGYVLAKRVKEA